MSFFKFLLSLCVFMYTIPGPIIRFPEKQSVTLSFVGDCTLGTQKGGNGRGTFNWYAENNEPDYFLEKVKPVFEEDDFTIANCEGVLSDNPLGMEDKGSPTAFWFIGPASSARVFSTSSVEIVGFSNNHMGDYGTKGISDTIDALEAADLTVAKHNEPLYLEKNGITVSILACRLRWAGNEKDLYKTLEEMVANSDFQIIYPHGGTEGTHQKDAWRETAYKNLIDRGADLIVGTHPHMLQPIERYNGGTIVYSLGNFCFGGNTHPENRTAIYQCTISLTSDGVVLESDDVVPCYVYTGSSNNYQPVPVAEDDPVYQKIYDFMYGNGESPV